MNRVRSLIHAEDAYRQRILGAQVTIAVLDTGICAAHPDFDNRIRGFRDIVHQNRQAYDDCSHGTHVSSIIGGSGLISRGKYMGVAPKCRLIHIKVLDHRGNGNKDHIIKGIEWVIANHQRYNIRILNLSAGTVRENKKRDMQLVEAVEKAWDAGIIVIVAAGNMGPEPMSITVPGSSKKVITVGSMDDCDKKFHIPGENLCYSGTGPTSECICKPDIVAPGSGIIACNSRIIYSPKQPYCKKSGTSMATPVVSGAIALLLEKYPKLSNVEVKIRLMETATDLHLPKNRQGWGLVDVRKLLK